MSQNKRIPDPNQSGRQASAPRKSRGGRGCLSAILYFMMVVGTSVLLAGVGWLWADDLMALTKEDTKAVMVITEEDKIGDVADRLGEAEIIRYPYLFKLYALFSNAEEKIDPGSYEVSAIMDYRALVYAMRTSSAYRSVVSVTIPEGFTLEQILLRLSDYGVNTYEELKETCDTYEFEYSFLEDVPLKAGRLEGFLFPDTYNFYVNESAVSAINKLLANFNRKLTAEMRKQVEKSGYSLSQILTVASLVEKEASGAAPEDERPLIASVIYNRLKSKNFPKLQIDATIQYVLPERKEKLSFADLEFDSPYNTYLYAGLPPGPICNPGLKAIKAAITPKNTSYYFYALTDEGSHAFSKTAAEHQAVIDANPGVYGGRS